MNLITAGVLPIKVSVTLTYRLNIAKRDPEPVYGLTAEGGHRLSYQTLYLLSLLKKGEEILILLNPPTKSRCPKRTATRRAR